MMEHDDGWKIWMDGRWFRWFSGSVKRFSIEHVWEYDLQKDQLRQQTLSGRRAWCADQLQGWWDIIRNEKWGMRNTLAPWLIGFFRTELLMSTGHDHEISWCSRPLWIGKPLKTPTSISWDMKTVIFEKRLSNVPKKNRGDLGHPHHWHRLAGIWWIYRPTCSSVGGFLHQHHRCGVPGRKPLSCSFLSKNSWIYMDIYSRYSYIKLSTLW